MPSETDAAAVVKRRKEKKLQVGAPRADELPMRPVRLLATVVAVLSVVAPVVAGSVHPAHAALVTISEDPPDSSPEDAVAPALDDPAPDSPAAPLDDGARLVEEAPNVEAEGHETPPGAPRNPSVLVSGSVDGTPLPHLETPGDGVVDPVIEWSDGTPVVVIQPPSDPGPVFTVLIQPTSAPLSDDPTPPSPTVQVDVSAPDVAASVARVVRFPRVGPLERLAITPDASVKRLDLVLTSAASQDAERVSRTDLDETGGRTLAISSFHGGPVPPLSLNVAAPAGRVFPVSVSTPDLGRELFRVAITENEMGAGAPPVEAPVDPAPVPAPAPAPAPVPAPQGPSTDSVPPALPEPPVAPVVALPFEPIPPGPLFRRFEADLGSPNTDDATGDDLAAGDTAAPPLAEPDVAPVETRPLITPSPSESVRRVASSVARMPGAMPRTGRRSLDTARRYPIPTGVALVVVVYLVFQGRIDRRDPKLANAPLHAGDDRMRFR